MLVRGEDKFGYYDDEPRPQSDYGEAGRAAHAHSVGRFQQLIAEQAAKY